VHIGCLQFFTSRHGAITANLKKQTPFHLIDHRAAPLCHELTTTLLAALSSEAATTAVNTADAKGNIALHGTARYNLDKDGNVIDCDDDDDLAVCHTCIRALLAVGADPNTKNKAGVQAVSILDMLTVARSDASRYLSTDEHVVTVKALRQAGLDINVTHYSDCTEYHLHNAGGHDYSYHCSSNFRLLLDCGANVMLHDDTNDWTAMQCAAYYEADRGDPDGSGGNADVIQMLYDAGGHELLEGTTADGRALLHLASKWPDSIQKLRELGAPVNARDNSGQTALHYATAFGSNECVRALLDNDADIHAYGHAASDFDDTGSWQPIHFAILPDIDIDIADMLLASGATIDAKTTTGCTAAWLVARYGDTTHQYSIEIRSHSDCTVCQQLERLFSMGADLMHYSDKHGSLLHAAAGNGDVAIIEHLLKKGLTLSSNDKMHYTGSKQTPLHCAAQGGHTAMVQLLIDQGCDVIDADTDGNTALRLCLQGPCDNAACFNVLLNVGADALDITTHTR
jgi:ankyrin repeat protein